MRNIQDEIRILNAAGSSKFKQTRIIQYRGTTMPIAPRDLEILSALEKKVLWLSTWMIHNANHLRSNTDGLKVGGHQASSASSATILSALYFHVLRPEDRVAVKPHASPVFHAIQYLFGKQSLEKLQNFRGLKGAVLSLAHQGYRRR